MKRVRIAAVEFHTAATRGAADAPATVLRETREALDALHGYGIELVVLSEAVQETGQPPEAAESLAQPGPFLSLYAQFAASARCHVAGPIKLRDERGRHSSLAFFGPDGTTLGVYHKVFLTDTDLGRGTIPGLGPLVLDTAIGRLGGVVCFDLNFASLRQQYRALRPDILAFASYYHGGLMQAMWAYDCRSFFVSSLPITGCGILDPFGRPVSLTHCYTRVARADINLDRVMVHLDYNRQRFPEIERKYGDEVLIDVPPHIGPALIYSQSPARTAADIAREFELTLLDDYLVRSEAHNAAARGAPA